MHTSDTSLQLVMLPLPSPLTQEVTFQDMYLAFELPCLLDPRDRG